MLIVRSVVNLSLIVYKFRENKKNVLLKIYKYCAFSSTTCLLSPLDPHMQYLFIHVCMSGEIEKSQ